VEKLTDKIIDINDVRKKGQASADPDAGADPDAAADPITDRAEIRKRVQEKIDEAKAQDPERGKKDNGDGGNISSSFIRWCLDSNVLGDAELYKAVNDGKFLYNTSMGSWMKWNGHHWELDRLNEAAAAMEDVVDQYAREHRTISERLAGGGVSPDETKWLQKLQGRLTSRIWQLRDNARKDKCLKFVYQSKKPLAIVGDEVDNNPWLLACANGVVDLTTGDFRPGRPEDYLLKASPIEWKGIDAPRKIWERALREIHDNDELMVEFLQRLFGMAIVGEVIESVFPVMVGPGGRNGKTTEVEAIQYVLGPLAGPIQSEMLLESYRQTSSAAPSPDIMDLRGMRLAIASETKDGAKVSAARCKWLTGTDSLKGRWPHDKFPIDFKPTHTLFLLTNFAPHTDVQDKAFLERMINIPYNIRFLRHREPEAENERKADPELIKKLHAEASGILAWLVEGCLKWQELGLKYPPRVIEEKAKYEESEDNIGSFIDMCCSTGDPGVYDDKSSDLYDVFAAWWRKYIGRYVPAHKRFGAYLGSKFEKRKTKGVYYYYGISLNHEVIDELGLDLKTNY
jgi:putative DNA primase/helicase